MNSSFVKWKGGGSDFGETLKFDEILNCNFVFAIADSDKHCPSDKIGKTAKGIKFLGHNRFNADYYILNDVLEVENLIPYKIVQDIFPRISELMPCPPKIATQLRYQPNEVRISPNRRLDITCAQRRYHCCVTTISLLRNYGLKHVKRCGIMKFANELRFGKIRL